MIILPSLEIVPAKYNTSTNTLLSQIPIDGTGDFTVTRATSPTTGQSTRVNALGLIELVADNVPRLDYPLGGAVNGCPALLVEPSAQNITLNSAVISGTPTGVSIDANVAVSPDGTTTADKLKEDSNPGNHNLQGIIGGALGGTVDSSAYRISIFAKADGRTQFTFFDNNQTGAGAGLSTFNLSNGTATGAGVIQNYGNGWYRCIISCAKTALTSANALVRLLDAGGNSSYTGDGTSGILFWGKQLEVGSVATSYIPTTVSGVTRATDVVTNTVASGLIGQTEGTLYAEFTVDFNNRNADILNVNDGSSSNGFFMSIRNSSVVQLIVRRAASNALIFQRTGTYPTGVNKLAVAYKNGDFAICLNGTTAQIDTTSITMPSVSINRVSLGQGFLYTLDQQLRIRAATLYQTRLTNTQLALLTSPYTSYSSMASALSYTLG